MTHTRSRTEKTDTRLFAVLCLTLFIVPWREAVPAVGPISIGRVLAVIMLTLAIANAINKGGFEWPIAFHVLFAAFIAWTAVSLLWTPDIGRGVTILARLGFPFVVVIAIWEVVDDRQRLELALTSLLLGGFMVMGFVGYEFLTTAIANRGTMIHGFNAAVVSRRLVYCVPLAGYLVLRSDRMAFQALGVAFCTAAFAAILAMVVRQALGTFVVGSGTVAVVEAGRRLSARGAVELPSRDTAVKAFGVTGVFIALLTAIGLGIYQQLSSHRASRIFAVDPSLTGRTDIWAAGWDIFWAEANPLLGLGVGAYNSYVGPQATAVEFDAAYLWPHSSLIGVTVELGIIGLVLFLAAATAGFIAIGERRPDLPIAASAASVWFPLTIVADVHLDVLGWALLTIIVVTARLRPYSRSTLR